MISLVDDENLPDPKIPVCYFKTDGSPVYTDKINGHFIWDTNPDMCDDDCDCHYVQDSEDDEDFMEEKRKRMEKLRRKKLRKETCRQQQAFFSNPPPPPSSNIPIPCMMFDSEIDFPPLRRNKNKDFVNVTTRLFINPSVNSTGNLSTLSQGEEVLNWQTQNSICQNQLLNKIDKKVSDLKVSFEEKAPVMSKLDRIFEDMKQRAADLDQELRYMIKHHISHGFDERDREIKKLTKEIREITERREKQASLELMKARSPSRFSYLEPSSRYVKETTFPLYLSDRPGRYRTQKAEPQQLLPEKESEPVIVPEQPKQDVQKQKDKQPYEEPVKPEKLPVYSSNKPLIISEPVQSQLNFDAKSESDDSEIQILDNTSEISNLSLLMAEPGESSSTRNDPMEVDDKDAVQRPKPTVGPYFTFDDLPPDRWRERILEFSAWLEVRQLQPYSKLKEVLDEFTSRFVGTLRDWFTGLGYYKQE